MVPTTSGFLDGFVSLGFPALVVSVIATLVGKGLLLPAVADIRGPGGLAFYKVAMWMALNLLPQFIYVSKYQLKLLHTVLLGDGLEKKTDSMKYKTNIFV